MAVPRLRWVAARWPSAFPPGRRVGEGGTAPQAGRKEGAWREVGGAEGPGRRSPPTPPGNLSLTLSENTCAVLWRRVTAATGRAHSLPTGSAARPPRSRPPLPHLPTLHLSVPVRAVSCPKTDVGSAPYTGLPLSATVPSGPRSQGDSLQEPPSAFRLDGAL